MDNKIHIEKDRKVAFDGALNRILGNEVYVAYTDYVEVSEAFDSFDANKDGFLSVPELKSYVEHPTVATSEQFKQARRLHENVSEIERASNDEWGLENNGITRADLRENFILKAKSAYEDGTLFPMHPIRGWSDWKDISYSFNGSRVYIPYPDNTGFNPRKWTSQWEWPEFVEIIDSVRGLTLYADLKEESVKVTPFPRKQDLIFACDKPRNPIDTKYSLDRRWNACE